MDVLLDARLLEPPEPLERVLDALAELGDDDRLRVQLRREPFPLYSFLSQMGLEWETTAAGGCVEVLIWSAAPARSSR